MTNLADFKEFLNTPRTIAIIPHYKPDADALGSALGLSAYLKKKGHQTQVIAPSDYPAFLHWMPGNDEVITYSEGRGAAIAGLIANVEMIFCVDFSALSRITNLGKLIYQSKAKKVLVDHHLEPEQFADYEQWNVKSASTAGLVYELIVDLGDRNEIDQKIADCLYAGLMTDTGNFRHNNTRREEFLIAADLVALGADPTNVYRLIYDTHTPLRMKLMGYVLSEKLKVLPDFNTAYITLSREDLRRFESQTGDTEGFVNFGLSIEGIRLSVMIYEVKEEVKLSFRSLGSFSVNDFARKHFDGGGHRNASGGSSKLSLEETVKKFLRILPEYKDQLTSGKV